ncbi:MAG: MMPL family transporter [Candidatus Polarisedimenticolia bacterium]
MDGGFYRRLAGAVIRRRRTVLVLYVLATLVLAWSASRLTLRSDITDLLPEGTPSADDLRDYLSRFGTADVLFVSLRAEGDGDDRLEDLEDAATRLREALIGSGLVRSVQFGVTPGDAAALLDLGMEHLPVLLPPEEAAMLRARLQPAAMKQALERVRDAASRALPLGPAKDLLARDPLGLTSLIPRPGASALPVTPDPGTGLFLSPDGTTLLVVVTPARPPQDTAFARRLLDEVARAEGLALAGASGITASHAGAYAIAVHQEDRIRHDIMVTASISMGVILLLYAAVLRRIGLLLIVAIPLSLSMLWTLGAAAVVPGHLNMVTVAFAAILLGVGDDALTHLYLRFREEVSRGAERHAALIEAMGSTGPSILIASLTSGLSFAALTFVRFRGLSELGLIAALGMINLLVSVYFLFPCLLAMLPSRPEARPPLSAMAGVLISFNHAARRRRGLVLAAAGLVTLAAAAAATRTRFSPDLASLRGEDPTFRQLESLMSPFGGLPETLHLVSDEGDLEASLRAAEAALPAVRALQARGELSGWTSPVLWMPSQATQRARHEALSDIAWRDVAADFRREADALGLRPDHFAPFLADLERWGNWDRVRLDPAAMEGDGPLDAIRMGLSGTAVATALIVPPGRDPAPATSALLSHGRVASVARVTSDLSSLIVEDFRRAAVIAGFMVLLAAATSFRSWRQLGLVSIPVVAGTVLMLGTMAMLGIPINLMNLVAVPMVFGLGIDFGVYIVNRHEEEGRRGIDTVLRHTGSGILLTGVTTLAGFGALLAADFPGLRSMGWVAVLGIGGCLAASLTLLPLLLLPGPPPASGRPVR